MTVGAGKGADPLTLKKQTLRGRTVQLEPLAESHAGQVVAWRNHPEVRPYFIARSPLTIEGQMAWTAGQVQRADDFTYVIREPGGQAVGMVAVYDIDRVAGCAEFGRLLTAPGARQKGYARDAAIALVAFAFEALGLQLLYAHCLADNLRVHRFFIAIGFTPAGELLSDVSGQPMVRFERRREIPSE